jgi:DNA modification methylase
MNAGRMEPYYDAGGVTIYHGSCIDVLPALEAVDHVITDPPYSEHVHSKSRAGSRPITGSVEARSVSSRANFSRVKEFGFAALDRGTLRACAREFGRLARRWSLVFSDVESSHIWRAALVRGGLEYVRTGAWVKVNGAPQFTGDRPAVAFEAITIVHPPGRKRWNGGGSHALWEHPIVLNRSRNDPRLHTTQKPEPLMRDLVLQFTDIGDLILDAFGGSGTTAEAAKRAGRRCILIERDEKYCEVSARRLEGVEVDERYTHGAAGLRGKQSALGF